MRIDFKKLAVKVDECFARIGSPITISRNGSVVAACHGSLRSLTTLVMPAVVAAPLVNDIVTVNNTNFAIRSVDPEKPTKTTVSYILGLRHG